MQQAEFVWHDGQLVPWEQATVHVAAHALQYGSSVFEGIRAYDLHGKAAVFCLEEHLDRLWDQCKIYRLEIPFTRDQIRQGIMDTIRANNYRACYIRPVIFRGWATMSLDGRSCPTHVSIIRSVSGNTWAIRLWSAV